MKCQSAKNNTIKKNTEVIFDASKEVTLEVNAEKTKYTCIPCYSVLRLVLFCYSALAFFFTPIEVHYYAADSSF
jgi:hypothetical protein